MRSAYDLNCLIMQHAEDYELSMNGMMNDGVIATKLGLQGIPDFAEKIIIEREREFTSLMLLSGQIKLLKELSKILNLRYSEFYNKIEDKYFN